MAATATIMSAKQYEAFAVTEEGHRVELHGGRLVEKPEMSFAHEWWQSGLAMDLSRQMDPAVYRVQSGARLKRSDVNYYIPDIAVVPVSLINENRGHWRDLNVYKTALPLVVEVWSPSTGDHDADEKIPEYQRRGDLEIWRLHPFERTLTVWRREEDGNYVVQVVRGGTIAPVAIPGVVIDLDALFE